MLTPSKRYQFCIEELKLWAQVALDTLSSLDPSSEPDAILERPAFGGGTDGGSKDGFSGLSIGYVMRRYFIAVGQLKNLKEIISAIYPEKGDQIDRDLRRYTIGIGYLLLEESEQKMLHELTINLQNNLTETPNDSPDVDNTADIICETRRYLDFIRGTESVPFPSKTMDALSGSPWASSIRQQVDALDYSQRLELAERMRVYLANNYVLNSMPVADTITRNFHETLLSTAKIPGQPMYEINIKGFLEQMASSELKEENFVEVRRTLESLGRILADVPFNDLSDVIVDWGGMPAFDGINVIPSASKKGACYSTLLATANGSGVSGKGILGIMRQVRRHLIDCFGKTQVVILLTDTWDPAKFRESRADIEAHRRHGVVFVTGVVSGRSINPTPLPF